MRGSVWAGETKGDAAIVEKGAEANVEELAPIVALDALEKNVKLSENIHVKAFKRGSSVGFVTEREGPRKMSEVIHNKQVVFIAREASDRRRPEITMH